MRGSCPVCNGFRVIGKNCTQCGKKAKDFGKYTDYFDNYSAYEEIDTVKLTDNIKNDQSEGLCPHLYYCENCHKESIVLIEEVAEKETPLFFD
ncbi:hypothetical protein [Alteribacter keqinensis]|uniref:Uncharacterized protein n=1 Tax=Alteribacter keqinensis TaxID=2483800 RepID=A0A3M7TTR0_9BACI|nr:hypothetical protein [Alteribacter keqinensis]RNA68679.1 hypothetical protein EBO34_01540 [Alteribacter keqinensis]